jgi:hypothetical protein
MRVRENIAVFAYSWSNPPYSKLDIYLNQFIINFQRLGFGVDVYIANQYVEHSGIHGMSKNIDINKLNESIKSKKYKLILSINNALLTGKLGALHDQPVVDLIVDDFNHLFNHDQTGLYDQFIYADKVLLSSYSHIRQLEYNNESVIGRVHFLPTATSVSKNSLKRSFSPKKHNISWIASLLDASGLALLYQRCIDSPNRTALLRHVVAIVREGCQIQYDERIGQENLDAILKEHKWSRSFFEMQIQNLISNETRISVAEKLHNFGLTIFGNHEWISAAAYHPKILNIFNDGKTLTSHKDIIGVYNSSKICINIPQIQTGSALPYRVIDILASDALLITNYHPESDAFSIFGKDSPIVMYKNLDELSYLCEYYLSHEDERLRLVEQCNEMVKNGFDFKDRCCDILNIAGFPVPEDISNFGSVQFIDSNKFVFMSKKIKVRFKALCLRFIKKMLSLIPLALRQSLIINLKY